MIDYKIVRKRGEKEYHRAVAKGRYPYLPALDDLLSMEETVGEEYLGTMEIPVHMIRGTKTAGRKESFSYGFMPLLEPGSEFAAKWVSLYDIQMDTGFTDPVKVYEYMNCFYVAEGNKRVSVMKYLNGDSILADVTRVIPKKTEEKDRMIYYEFLDFYRVTGIYGITFSELGCYKRLAEYFGRDLQTAWPEETVRLLKTVFVYFGVLFAEKGGGRLDITAADALLIYLSVYSIDSLTCKPPEEIRRRMDKLWKEFRTGIREEAIDIVDTPELFGGTRSSGIFSLFAGSVYSEAKPLRVAFVHEKDAENSSWVYSHELGREYLEECFDGIVTTEVFSDCGNDEAVRAAIDRAVEHGAEVIFTTSPSLMAETFRSAIHYPKIRFLNCSVKLQHQAVRTYYTRSYEVKFVLGALAACLAENHRIGYRADYPIYGYIANINAFAAGAAMIDPQSRVILTWATKEKSDWRRELAEQEVSVISGADMQPLHSTSREYGLYRYEAGEPVNLAVPCWNWGRYYELILRTVMNGTWDGLNAVKRHQAVNYWYGMSSGILDLQLLRDFSPGTRRMVKYLRDGIVSGNIYPFEGELKDRQGRVRQREGRMSNEGIIGMDWLLDNVDGSLPKLEELKSTAKNAVSVSGVIEK